MANLIDIKIARRNYQLWCDVDSWCSTEQWCGRDLSNYRFTDIKLIEVTGEGISFWSIGDTFIVS